MSKRKYYSLDKIKALKCQYSLIFGERSNGKTYACLKEILDLYKENGWQGAYIRRWDEDIQAKRMNCSAPCPWAKVERRNRKVCQKKKKKPLQPKKFLFPKKIYSVLTLSAPVAISMQKGVPPQLEYPHSIQVHGLPLKGLPNTAQHPQGGGEQSYN